MTDTEIPPTNGETHAPPMSLAGRLTNIIVAPSDAFDDIKDKPVQAANWLIPMAMSIIMGIIYTMVIFSQPQILQGMREAQEKAMQQQVDAGKMTQAQADQALQVSEKFMSPTVFKVFGIVGSMFGITVMLFLMSLLLWLIATFALRTPLEFMKVVEIVGLSMVIGMLDSVVRMLLAIIYANPSMSLGPVLFIKHFNPQNHLHMLLAWINVFLFWQIAIWALGLARVTGQKFIKPFLWIFCTLLVIVGGFVGVMMLLTQALSRLGGK